MLRCHPIPPANTQDYVLLYWSLFTPLSTLILLHVGVASKRKKSPQHQQRAATAAFKMDSSEFKFPFETFSFSSSSDDRPLWISFPAVKQRVKAMPF